MVQVDIRQVRMFVAVADALSFTRAAEKLHVAQPWLSVQIRKLEEQVGFQLFLRNRNRAIVLTREAEAFLAPARTYLEAAVKVGEAVEGIRGHQAITFRLGAPDFSADIPGRADLLDRFMKRYPNIDIEIVNDWSAKLLDALADHQIDMAFTVGPTDRCGFDVVEIATYRWAVLVTEDQSAGWGRDIPLSTFRGKQIASFRRNINPAFADSIARRFAVEDVELVALTEPSTGGIRQHVARHHVPVLVSEWHARTAPIAPGLVVVPFNDANFRFQLHLVCRADDERPIVRALVDLTRRFVRQNHHSDSLSTAA